MFCLAASFSLTIFLHLQEHVPPKFFDSASSCCSQRSVTDCRECWGCSAGSKAGGGEKAPADDKRESAIGNRESEADDKRESEEGEYDDPSTEDERGGHSTNVDRQSTIVDRGRGNAARPGSPSTGTRRYGTIV